MRHAFPAVIPRARHPQRAPSPGPSPARRLTRRPRSPAGLLAWAERGSAMIWVTLTMPLFLSIIGLAIDGGVVFNARREIQNVADGAARAAAMQIDQGGYRRTSGVSLNQAEARRVATEYLRATCQSEWRCHEPQTNDQMVLIRIDATVPTAFLPLVGITSVPVSVTAPAWVRYGVDRPEN